MIVAEEAENFLKVIPPPELHIMNGIFGKIYKELSRDFPQQAQNWIDVVDVKKNFHNAFDGNATRLLLKNSLELERISPGNKYTGLIEALNEIVEACFGSTLQENYQAKIDSFFALVDKICIPYNVKMHVLRYHVPQFIKLTGKPLGPFSEQTSEAAHCAYNRHSENFSLRPSSKTYLSKLKRSVTTFNALRE